MFEAVLVSLADHGFTPTAIAARVTYTSAPESLQGALAAGLLGGGSRFLGVTEDAAIFLSRVPRRAVARPDDAAGGTSWPSPSSRRRRPSGRLVPGLGHPVHKVEDPRTPVLFELARRDGTFGDHLELFAAIGRVHPADPRADAAAERRRRRAARCSPTSACPCRTMRGFALLARCAGLLGHLAEEQRDPDRHGHLPERRPQHRLPPRRTGSPS